jgi:hypothetical protein
MRNQTQDDFASLHAAINNHISSHQLVDRESVLPSNKATRHEKCVDEETYTPVNFIKAEVYALIAGWEACKSNPEESEEASEFTRDSPSEDLYEPSRHIPSSAPPKRFYRTFWRSVTRRMLEHARKSVISSIADLDHSRSC